MRTCLALIVVTALSLCTGCGSSDPFPIAPVSGTLKYSDGSLLTLKKTDIVTVRFAPQGIAHQGPSFPPPSSAVVDAQGKFVLKIGDGRPGAVIGKHQVSVKLALDYPNPPQDATPTPALVDVPAAGTTVELTIPKK